MPIAEAVGFGAAMDYVSAVGVEAIAAYESELASYALERLAEVGGV
jgi:cysteine desulfurase/selenocysteine lyase